MHSASVSSLFDEWQALEIEYQQLEGNHKDYLRSVQELGQNHAKCSKAISHLQYRQKQITQALKFCRTPSDDDLQKQTDLRKLMASRRQQLAEIGQDMPKPNGLYLKVILGNVSVSLMKEEEKYKYKEEYERFKLIVTSIILLLSLQSILVSYRALDSVLHFLQVWYYCTLTIRESILVVNGSRIKGWWRAHHFLTTIAAGVIIVWPDGPRYEMFRHQYMWYTAYISILQFMQFYYQQGCLYRLRALGERYNMDITIEGFHSWMWRGLSFLLPFLFFGYCFQLYNAIVLYNLSNSPDCTEWQVFVSSLFFLCFFMGNAITTSRIMYHKLKEKLQISKLKTG